MSTTHVRIGRARQNPAETPPKLRRKPSQERARISSQALQEAFVRILLERGYEKITIRELTDTAGVSIGSFYEYFANKKALAALVIHRHIRQLSKILEQAEQEVRELSMADAALLITRRHLRIMLADPELWSRLFQLERLVSPLPAFCQTYETFVSLWQQLLSQTTDPPLPERLPIVARMIHALSYGWISQTLLTSTDPPPDPGAIESELHNVLQAYLKKPPYPSDR